MSQNSLPYKRGSLLFAPMEGVTDEVYRNTVQELFPEWDYMFCDFYRIPSVGKVNPARLMDHYGRSVYEDQTKLKKTGYQILTTMKALTIEGVKYLNDFKFPHLDLNLGCPSKKVNAHLGGAYLLGDLKNLEKLLTTIRKNFDQTFTVKIRTGYKNTENFDDLIRVCENSGAEAITLHGRTRDQLYKGKANWEFIKRAVEIANVPIIGNGDLWSEEDIERMFDETGCYAVMLGRGALKTPWMARWYQEYKSEGQINEVFQEYERIKLIEEYFATLKKKYEQIGMNEDFILGRFKSLSRYLYEDFEDAENMTRKFLRSRTLHQFEENLSNLK